MSKRVFLDPLVPRVRRCNACQRFGHLAQYCRSGTAPHRIICERCGEKGHAKSVCTGPARCINCIRAQLDRVDHEASAGTCPSFLKEKGIRMIMARFNVLRPEADEIYIECGGVPGRRWTRYSRAIPNPTLGDFLPPRTTAPSYADVVAAPSSKHPPVEMPVHRACRGPSWPPIPLPPLSPRSKPARATSPTPLPTMLPSHNNPPSNTILDPLKHCNRPKASVASRFVHSANANSIISAESSMAPFVSADLLQRVKSKYTEKFATDIYLPDTVSYNLISSILERSIKLA
ncbi:uncharacterized protein LOC109859346 [Pseudomyrmex gracilis]|uniref:uncharacterized protein LOC109859346 n=1 Tax=Pseudomyrmex gracilis TaxID=219809 RepID=UPI000995DD4F|nr:uncharacterized protein LOC109859346 [Pseudomyrmex gracilis]